MEKHIIFQVRYIKQFSQKKNLLLLEKNILYSHQEIINQAEGNELVERVHTCLESTKKVITQL